MDRALMTKGLWVSVVMLLSAMTFAVNASEDDGLFMYSSEQISELPEKSRQTAETLLETHPAIENFALVRIRTGSLLRKDPYVTFNLPDDRRVDFMFSEQYRSDNGRVVWKGAPVDTEGQAAFFIHRGKVTGSFNIGDQYYEVTPLDEHHHALTLIDPNDFPEDHYLGHDTQCPDEPEGDCHELPGGGGGGGGGTGGAEIRILVAFTQAADQATADLGSRIAQFIDQTNTAFANSNVSDYANARLAAAVEVDYNELNRSYSQHLSALSGTTDGQMDSLHSIRDYYKADVVALVVNDSESCGRAGAIGATSSSAFFAIHYSCTGYTFPHELGHLFGARHNPEVDSNSSPYPYGHGYLNPDGDFRTVMAYNCPGGCPRVAHFSNPNVYYSSAVTGTTSEHDVGRVIRERASTLSGFRSGSTVSIPAPSLSVTSTACWDSNWASWSEVDGAEEYRLYRSSSSSMTSPALVYQGTGLSTSVRWRSDGANYYAVKACIGADCSGYSNVDTATYFNGCL